MLAGSLAVLAGSLRLPVADPPPGRDDRLAAGVTPEVFETWASTLAPVGTWHALAPALAAAGSRGPGRHVHRARTTAAVAPDPAALALFSREVRGDRFPPGVVALTFDDGPHRTYTPELLDLLSAHQVPATFFMLGQQARAFPQVAAMVRERGHEIAGHTVSHERLTVLPLERVEADVAACRTMIRESTGANIQLFRCPYGARDAKVLEVLDRQGLRHVLWSVDSRDWADRNPRSIADRVIRELTGKHGAIVLMHDIHPQSIAAARLLLDALEPARRAGTLRLVKVSEGIAAMRPTVIASVSPPARTAVAAPVAPATGAPGPPVASVPASTPGTAPPAGPRPGGPAR